MDAMTLTSEPDLDAVWLSLAALVISLLAVLVPALNGALQRKRDDRAKRAEMYLELMEHVERHGLWVVDMIHDLLNTANDDYWTTSDRRRTSKPDRADRVRMRAILSAYASLDVFAAHERWFESLERFEQKLDYLSFIASEDGPDSVPVHEVQPVGDAEAEARAELADVVNRGLVGGRLARKGFAPGRGS